MQNYKNKAQSDQEKYFEEIKKRVFPINSEEEFNPLMRKIFVLQYIDNLVYNIYCRRYPKYFAERKRDLDFPFLPIEFFKTHKVITGDKRFKKIFRSSGTTGQAESLHYVSDLSVYEKSSVLGFEMAYGSLADYTILALLPSYLEKKHSSLVWMTKLFISKSNFVSDCGFFKDNHNALLKKLKEIMKDPSRKILLFGVSYALLDLAEKIDFPLNKNVIVMETGGMKGRRKEMIREELHSILCSKMGIKTVHSEYGMTEMLSQAYSKGNGIFKCPPWMKVQIRDMNDPLTLLPQGKRGAINIIDLANYRSCSFIATQDVGICHKNGTFEVLGRFDHSDTRGCNLMME